MICCSLYIFSWSAYRANLHEASENTEGKGLTGAGEEQGHERLIGVGGDAVGAILPLEPVAGWTPTRHPLTPSAMHFISNRA